MVRMKSTNVRQPFHLIQKSAGQADRGGPGMFRTLAAGTAERFMGLPRLNRLYGRVSGSGQAMEVDQFTRRLMRMLDVKLEVLAADLARIPREGPLVLVANHPLGALDGLALLAMARTARPDVKLLATSMMRNVPELADCCFFVDVFGGPGARTRNIGAMKAARRWLDGGGALAVFPAGAVSRCTLWDRQVTDAAWSEHVGRLILASGAAAQPIYFHGRNSNYFQAAGLVHWSLRTAMLPREILRKRHGNIRVEIGATVKGARLKDFKDAGELMVYLRGRTYGLAGRGRGEVAGAGRTSGPGRAMAPVVEAMPGRVLAAEIAALTEKELLMESGAYAVHLARAAQIPMTLREIGRLREITFRGVGEGTGQLLDIDSFDQHYHHLFVWHRQRQELVGAYRLGLMDEILRRQGVGGLYTSTLFKFRAGLAERLESGIELGRSFVRPEYQREYAPLMLLWKGILGFVASNPRYRLLLGAVSVSNDYRPMSRWAMMGYLQQHRPAWGWEKLVRARSPLAPLQGRHEKAALQQALAGLGSGADATERLEDLIRDIEGDRAGMPVLLRQYLKLNARLLGFNVDKGFADVLDGLMAVDLTQVEGRMLGHYMGREGAQRYLAAQGAMAAGD